MKRIMLIGSGGAGKSTLARRLGEILHLKVYHLDTLFWKPGWVSMEQKEWMGIMEDLIEKDSWIADGNYGDTIHLRLKAADTVIFLDFSRWICLYRIIIRMLKYRRKSRPDLAGGCIEKWDWKFIKWVWQFPDNERPGVIKMLETCSPDTRIITPKNPKEVEEFILSLTEKHIAQ